MSLLLFLQRRARVVWLITVILLVLGVQSAYKMPSGIYPEMEFPRIVVLARTGGAPPDVFITSVTRPLEQSLTQVIGLERIRSKTIRGATEISMQFAPTTDMWRALQLVDSRVAEVRSALPSDTQIVVERVTTGSFPVMTFNVAGPVDPRELRELAEFTLRPALATVAGVGRIDVLGGGVREVEIILNAEALVPLHLNASDVADRLRTASSLNAIGRIDRDRQLVTVLSDAQAHSLAEIQAMPIAVHPDGSVVTVGQVAEVIEGAEDPTIFVGGPRGATVTISVARMPEASTPEVVAAALAATAALKNSLPANVTVEPVYDQATLVREAMLSVRDAILFGIVLCAAVIALFLRDLRAGAIAALSVPITLLMTFGLMRLAHQTLNLMSLGGMAVAVGLVVDDAIVIIEAILVRRDQGESPIDAAMNGTKDLARAVFGTTLATVVVFVPLALLDGVVGAFFRALAFTVVTAVVISLVVAVVLVPLGASAGLTSVARKQTSGRSKYGVFVARIIRLPKLAAFIAAASVVLCGLAARRVERGFLPTMDEGCFVIDYYLPAGTSLATTESFARRLETELRTAPEIKTFTRRTGAELGPAAATLLSRGDIMVRLVDKAARKRDANAIMADLRGKLAADLPEVRVEFVQVLQDVLNDLAGNPRPVEVKVFGTDYGEVGKTATALATELRGVNGLVDLYDGVERDAPELRLVARREATAKLGLTPDDVSAKLQTALKGTQVGTMPKFDRLIGIRVRYPDALRFDSKKMLDLPFLASGHALTFDAVAQPVWTASAAVRLHEALQPTMILTADHENRDLGGVADDVEAIVKRTKTPPGVRLALGGQLESQRRSVRDLALMGGFATLLVLTVLATQFRRLRLAALVLINVPVAICGALLALVITRTPLNASSLMGCVLLVGLVVKNGVLLLEEAERLVEEGVGSVEAVIQASARRVRPVMMTTLATLAGLLPLALGIGAGAEMQRPLAIAVIGGLLTSTLATLVLLPPIAERTLRQRVPS